MIKVSQVRLTKATDSQLAREARAFVALILRNGPIEDIHTGKVCPTCARDPTYSRVSDDEQGNYKVSG